MAENQISLKISAELLTENKTPLTDLETKLKPLLVALTPQQIKEMLKMSDKTVAFANKIINYVATNPEFVPNYMNVEEMNVDDEAANNLTELYNRIMQLANLLNNTIKLCRSEVYQAALHYYANVKQSAKANIPGAQTIYDDLKSQFEKTTTKSSEETETK